MVNTVIYLSSEVFALLFVRSVTGRTRDKKITAQSDEIRKM